MRFIAHWFTWQDWQFTSDAARANNREILVIGIGWGWFGMGFVIGRRANSAQVNND